MAFEARITAPALIDNQHTMTAELQFPEWLRVEQTDTISVLRFPPSVGSNMSATIDILTVR